MIKKQVGENLIQITLDEKRWYFLETDKEDIPFPAVTWILDSGFPKDIGFDIYLTEKVHSWEQAKSVLAEAGDRGTRVHWGIEKYERHIPVDINDVPAGFSVPFTAKEWEMILTAKRWFDHYQPIIESVEQVVYNIKDGYAGTVDLICLIDQGRFEKVPTKTGVLERWVIDWKTSKQLYDSHKAQVAAYNKTLELKEDDYPVRTGIVRLGSKHKVGYEFWQDQDDIDYYFSLFMTARTFWQHKNPEPAPKIIEVPEHIKMEIYDEN